MTFITLEVVRQVVHFSGWYGKGMDPEKLQALLSDDLTEKAAYIARTLDTCADYTPELRAALDDFESQIFVMNDPERALDGNEWLKLLDAVGRMRKAADEVTHQTALTTSQYIPPLSDRQIAQKLSIGPQTVGRWVKSDQEPRNK